MTYVDQNFHPGSHTNLSISDIGAMRAINDALLGALVMPFSNQTWITERNASDSANVNMFRIDSSNRIEVGAQLYRNDDGLGFGESGSFVRFRRVLTNYTSLNQVIDIFGSVRGTGTVSERLHGTRVTISDGTGVANKTITGAANNGSGLIRITATSHDYSTGDRIAVYGVGGTTEANGSWTVTVITADTFDLQGSTFVNAYTSGGTATNRSMYYGFGSYMNPSVARGGLTGTAANGDDVNCFTGYNGGTAKGTDAYYLGHNAAIGGSEWIACFTFDAWADYGIRLNGTYTNFGLDFYSGTYTLGAVRMKNNTDIMGRNAADNANNVVLRWNNLDEVQFLAPLRTAGITVGGGSNIAFSTSTGTKIGTGTTQLIAFHNSTPVAQHSSTGETVGFTAGGGTTVTDASTFTGNVGSTAYRISDIVKALKNKGLMAA